MGKKFLADTNIIIYLLKDELPTNELEIFTNSFGISVVSKIEFLGWKGFNEKEFLQAKEVVDNIDIFDLSNEIVLKTIQIKREQRIKTPDAIIAATCLIENRILVTRNKKDFNKIQDLTVHNPFE